MRTTSLLHTQTLTRALEFALAKGGFGKNAQHRKTAIALLKEMKSNKSVSGRYQQLMRLLQKGATIEQMIKGHRRFAQDDVPLPQPLRGRGLRPRDRRRLLPDQVGARKPGRASCGAGEPGRYMWPDLAGRPCLCTARLPHVGARSRR